MRILVLNWKDLAHPHAGGAEVYTARITEQWALAGHDVTIFCAAVAGHPEVERVRGVRIVRRGGRYGVYGAARRWLKRQPVPGFDVIVDEVNTRPFLTPQWNMETPVVALIHQVCREIWSYEMPWPVSTLGRHVLEPRWLRQYRNTHVVTVSPSSRASLAEYGLHNVQLVPEGVESLQRPNVCKEGVPTVVFVGRLTGNKRPIDAVQAFAMFRRDVPEAQLWVVGDGPDRPRAEATAGQNVTFFGRVDEAIKFDLMARAHVLVVTSVREGWGLVVDEAAAMGTPALGYDVPGLCDSLAAAGGEAIAPRPAALAQALTARFCGGASTAAAEGWSGGAVPWPEVAEAVLRNLKVAVAEFAPGATDSVG